MNSRTTERFRREFARLPAELQEQARAAYRLFRQDPHPPGLRFRRVHPTEPVYSARVGLHYRAVGVLDGDTITWFWIGSHAAYAHLIRQL
jgi:hypothetical protein